MDKIKKNTTLLLLLFLLGIFMGAMDNGIVSPARNLIQNSFNVSAGLGTWLITLYTLVYAVSMPITSKLSDRYGYKKIYILSIALFGLGSLLVGLNNFYGTFTLLLISRVIQAVGAGGIMPIANNAIGQSFPEEKRGFALGMVGGMYGIATILGPTLGSVILSIAGTNNWGWIFFINVPFSIAVIILSLSYENIKIAKDRSPLDLLGSLLIAVVIGSLMYALTNLDFFSFINTLKSTSVYPFLIIFAASLMLLILVEKRAKDPVLNLSYFTDRQLLATMIIAFLVGVGMMGMIFIPQFSENVLKLEPGKGGYLVTILAVFAGIASPLSGMLIDRKSARFVLLLGFSFTVLGTLFMALVVVHALSFMTLLIGLALMGIGVGFTMGAPLNYIVLGSVEKEHGASALATMSVIRSIGITLSPSIMIGFVVQAGKNMPAALMNVLSTIMPKGMTIPTSSNGTSPFAVLQNSSAYSIVNDLKTVFDSIVPPNVATIVNTSIEKIGTNLVTTFQNTLNAGYANLFYASAVAAFLGFIGSVFLRSKNSKGIKE